VGVFDSGIGGLTVLAAIRRQLPHEHYLYLGDTARLPYGTKSPETVARYALRAGRFLVKQNIKMLVVACNTASAAALHVLQAALPVPVMGVVLPGARVAAHRSRGVVGVIATESTIASSAYSRAVLEQHPGARIISQACPLFVPLAEEGWFDHEVTRVVAGMYLAPLVAAGVDTVILGCTHYPLLRDAIAAEFAEDVVLVDSGDAVAEEVTTYLNEVGKRREEPGGDLRVFVTDTAERFQRIANTIIPSGLTTLELVDLPE
jgi:glutamate racemase